MLYLKCCVTVAHIENLYGLQRILDSYRSPDSLRVAAIINGFNFKLAISDFPDDILYGQMISVI